MEPELKKPKTSNNSESDRDNKNMDYSTLLPKSNLKPMIQSWLIEDHPTFDIGGFVVGTSIKTANLYMKSDGVFAGKPFVDAVFDEVGCEVTWNDDVAIEGNYISMGGDNTSSNTSNNTTDNSSGKVILAVVKGPANAILKGERTALNTLSRCSGVATSAYKSTQKVKQIHPTWSGAIAGTRKVTPGSFRIVEKYGLILGGCNTHRLDLSQMTMLKDNHIWACGGDIAKAVQMARSAAGFSTKIEVECQSKEEAITAASAGADIVMLDNFGPEGLKADAKIVKQQFPHLIIEASGGITFDTMADYVSDDVDIISRGDLTQGYSCLDYSLKVQK
jgi:nicotinate-nucleotide pyrophosphorylase (carboxylating)